MKFMIQTNLINQTAIDMAMRCTEKYPRSYARLVPFSHKLLDQVYGGDYIPYGSCNLSEIGRLRGWTGTHYDLSVLNYEAFVENRDDMLNSDGIMTLHECVEYLDGIEDGDRRFFMRPSEDTKRFSGEVFKASEALEWIRDRVLFNGTGSYLLPPEMKVVISKPHDIKEEWRWFIVGGVVVSGSRYRLNGRMDVERITDGDLVGLAQELADKWIPLPCCVMDTCTVDGMGHKVVEFNCINSSGFYDHDMQSVFDKLWEYHNDRE